MNHYIHGSTYPVGGSGAIPRKLNAVVSAGKGRSFVQARVEGLLFDAPDAESAAGRCSGVMVNGMPVSSSSLPFLSLFAFN